MNNLNLPEPIAAYFEADKNDGHAVACCFTEEGVVRDEEQYHVGLDAITAWKNAASARFFYVTEPFSLNIEGQEFFVSARVTGNFPSSPVVLQFIFSLEGGKIASLEIKP